MTIPPNIHYFGMKTVSELVLSGTLTATDLTNAMLDRIDALDGRLGSYAHVCHDHARARALAADSALAETGVPTGPLHGIPVALKDLCDTRFAPTTVGMGLFRDRMPAVNATVVDRLEAAGAIILGKLTMTEGAYGGHHPDFRTPVNPFGSDYWVGSSSTGSGVATAAGLCFAALGSDTGGSIRYPCATCGLTGLKPTWGRVSRHGVFPLAPSMDHVGPMARSAEDCGILFQVIAGLDPSDPTTLDAPVATDLPGPTDSLKGLRIGIDTRYVSDGVHRSVHAALLAAIDVFRRLEAEIVEVSIPPYEELVASWVPMCAVETALAHRDTYPSCASEYGANLAGLIELGRRVPNTEIARGHARRLAFSSALNTVFDTVDLLICPTMPTPTPTVQQTAAFGADPNVLNAVLRFTAPFNFSGHPALTLPNGMDRNGMPHSMQIIGPHLGETDLLRAGACYQTATDWHLMRPDPSRHPSTTH